MSAIIRRFPSESVKCPVGALAQHAALGMVDVQAADGHQRTVALLSTGIPGYDAEDRTVPVQELTLVDPAADLDTTYDLAAAVSDDDASLDLATLSAWSKPSSS